MNIAIVVAMEGESRSVYANLGEFAETIENNAFKYDVFKNKNHRICLIHSGIGQINAALAAQYMILEEKPDLMVNFGLVGSLSDNYRFGDIVLVDRLVHYDFSLLHSDESKMGIYPGKTTSECVNQNHFYQNSVFDGLPRVKIASGDKFINSEKMKDKLIRLFGAEICDMESYAIYHTCSLYEIPSVFIKCISDRADSQAEIDFSRAIKEGTEFYTRLIADLLSSDIKR